MSADVLLALPSRPFNFSNVQGNATKTLVVARAVCVEQLHELVVVVRVHAVSIGAGATLQVTCVATAPTAEQPEIDYSSDETLASLDVDGSAAGALLRAVIQPPLPAYVQLRLVVEQPASPQTIQATLSFDATGKR